VRAPRTPQHEAHAGKIVSTGLHDTCARDAKPSASLPNDAVFRACDRKGVVLDRDLGRRGQANRAALFRVRGQARGTYRAYAVGELETVGSSSATYWHVRSRMSRARSERRSVRVLCDHRALLVGELADCSCAMVRVRRCLVTSSALHSSIIRRDSRRPRSLARELRAQPDPADAKNLTHDTTHQSFGALAFQGRVVAFRGGGTQLRIARCTGAAAKSDSTRTTQPRTAAQVTRDAIVFDELRPYDRRPERIPTRRMIPARHASRNIAATGENTSGCANGGGSRAAVALELSIRFSTSTCSATRLHGFVRSPQAS